MKTYFLKPHRPRKLLASRKKTLDRQLRIWQKSLLWIVFFSGLFLLHFALQFRVPLSARAMDTAQVGRNLALGRGEESWVVRPLDLAPGRDLNVFPRWRYPWLETRLVALFFKVFGFDDSSLAIYSTFFFLLSLGMAYLFAGGGTGGKRTAFLAFILAFTSPVLLRSAISGLPHTVLAFLLVIVFLSLSRLPAPGAALAAGLAAGAGLLVDYDWMFLPPLVIGYVGIFSPSRRPRNLALALAGFGAIFFPWFVFAATSGPHPLAFHLRHGWLTRSVIFPEGSADMYYRAGEMPVRLPLFMVIGKLNRGMAAAYGFIPRFSGNLLAPLFLLSLFTRDRGGGEGRLKYLLVAMIAVLAFWTAAGRQETAVMAAFVPVTAVFAAEFVLGFIGKQRYSSSRSRRAVVGGLLLLNVLPVLLTSPARAGGRPELLPSLTYASRMIRAEEAVATNDPELTSWYANRRAVLIPIRLEMMAKMMADQPEVKFLLLTPGILESADLDPAGGWRGIFALHAYPVFPRLNQTIVLPGPIVFQGDKSVLLRRVSARW